MSMLMRLPKYLPPLDVLLHDIHRPTPAALAQAMGVTESTAKRWIANNEAPKPVLLALFWLTRWGMQWTDADLYNEAQLHFSMNRCQARQILDLKGKLRRAAKLGNFGSANDPAEGIELPVPDGTKVVQVKRERGHVPGVPRRANEGARLAPGVIRERQVKPPVGYHQFVHKKRRAA
jgi:hypothetical protein